jgi:transcriptional regulator with XRE-family HTH domain
MIRPVDAHVGNRIRRARIMAGVTQEQLGKSMGVTFQQVQKYEIGKNRCAPSRLAVVAEKTGQTIAWFFEGLDQAASDATGCIDPIGELGLTKSGHRLAAAYLAMPPRVKASFVELAESIVQPTVPQ